MYRVTRNFPLRFVFVVLLLAIPSSTWGDDGDGTESHGASTTNEDSADCTAPPNLKGVPTGGASFQLTGNGHHQGEIRYFNFGDVLLSSGGEAGLWALQIWGLDSCGLWIRVSSHDGYIMGQPELVNGSYVPLRATEAGTWRVPVHGSEVLEISQSFADRFKVKLLVSIPPHQGE